MWKRILWHFSSCNLHLWRCNLQRHWTVYTQYHQSTNVQRWFYDYEIDSCGILIKYYSDSYYLWMNICYLSNPRTYLLSDKTGKWRKKEYLFENLFPISDGFLDVKCILKIKIIKLLSLNLLTRYKSLSLKSEISKSG